MTTKREHYKSLCRDIIRHNDSYYVDRIEEIDDMAYDDMVLELIDIETRYPKWVTDYSPSQDQQLSVNISEPLSPHTKTRDYYPEIYTTSAISEWSDHSILEEASLLTQALPFGCEYVLNYVRGDLVSVITQGTGRMGNNHTRKLDTLACIPNSISVENQVTLSGVLTAKSQSITRRLSGIRSIPERLEYLLHLEENLEFIVTSVDQTNAQLPSMCGYLGHAERLGFKTASYIRADSKNVLDVTNGILQDLSDESRHPFETEKIRVSYNSLYERRIISNHVNQELRERYDPSTTWRPYGLECLWGFEYMVNGTL